MSPPPDDVSTRAVLVLTLRQQPYSNGDDALWQASATDVHGNYYRLEWDTVDIEADDCCDWERYRITVTSTAAMCV